MLGPSIGQYNCMGLAPDGQDESSADLLFRSRSNAPVDIVEEPRLARAPSQPLLRAHARCRNVERKEAPEPGKMTGRFFGRFRDDRHAQAYPVYAYHHAARLQSAKVRAFLDFVVALTREAFPTDAVLGGARAPIAP
jgi:hypothetical protein